MKFVAISRSTRTFVVELHVLIIFFGDSLCSCFVVAGGGTVDGRNPANHLIW